MSWSRMAFHLQSGNSMNVSKLLPILICMSLWMGSVPAHAGVKTITLKGASNWLVDWSENSCVLARKFGTKDKPLLLSMRTYAPGYRFEITVAGKQASFLQSGKTVTVSYGAGQGTEIAKPQNGHTDNYGPAVIFSASINNTQAGGEDGDPTPYPDTAFEAGLNRVTIATSQRELVLETGAMAKAMSTLRQCTDNLVKVWGLDPEVQRTLSRQVSATDLKAWARMIQAEFPPELQMMRRGARVNIRVLVDSKGSPSHCDATQAFDNTDFNVRACRIILKNARFVTALDKNGNPTDSYYQTVIVYRMD